MKRMLFILIFFVLFLYEHLRLYFHLYTNIFTTKINFLTHEQQFAKIYKIYYSFHCATKRRFYKKDLRRVTLTPLPVLTPLPPNSL